jgi:hypothetical protein
MTLRQNKLECTYLAIFQASLDYMVRLKARAERCSTRAGSGLTHKC